MITPEEANIEHALKKAVSYHGHLCPGTVIGVRMSLIGLEMIGITDPKGSQRKDIVTFAENDRCTVDAIQSVTGCKVSARALKLYDYGKVAVTFLNLKTKKAVRIVCPDSARELVDKYAPEDIKEKKDREISAYKTMPREELFKIQHVEVDLSPDDMPGHAMYRVICDSCGEWVSDHREVKKNNKTLCKSCAYGGYYRVVS
ncbi:MAG: FmdE family protein [Nitrospirota bacterium]